MKKGLNLRNKFGVQTKCNLILEKTKIRKRCPQGSQLTQTLRWGDSKQKGNFCWKKIKLSFLKGFKGRRLKSLEYRRKIPCRRGGFKRRSRNGKPLNTLFTKVSIWHWGSENSLKALIKKNHWDLRVERDRFSWKPSTYNCKTIEREQEEECPWVVHHLWKDSQCLE